MPWFDPDDLDDFERMRKFRELADEYGEEIAAWETAPWTSYYEIIQRDGIRLAPPEEVDETTLCDRLWQVVESLATRNAYLCDTNHLSDRQLYRQLVCDVLHESTKDYEAVIPKAKLRRPGSTVHCIDMCDFSDPSHERDFLRYYATETIRDDYERDHPNEKLPPHEEPPYDRDQYLPRAVDEWERLDDDEWLYDLD